MVQITKPLILNLQRSWRSLAFIPLLLLFFASSVQSQIVINEFGENNTVELKNIGSATVDISTYWLCDFPAYDQLSTLNIVCGSLNLAAGEVVAFDDWSIDANDSELGLYTTNSFGSSTALIDYVEWGSSGHQRASVAANAGIWTTGDFLPSIPAGESYAYDGDGDASSDFTSGSNTFCADNDSTGGGCDADGGTLTGGPFTFDQVGDGVADNIPAGSITVAGQTGANFAWVVTDSDGYILGLPPMPSAVNFDNPGAGTCLIWRIAYDGALTGVGVGLNANDIQGCFSLSNPIEVIRNNASGCDANGGELFGGPFDFTVDGTPDFIPAGSITLANSNGSSQWVITDDQGNILGLPPMPSVVDFDAAGVGVCYVYNVSYIDEITGLEAGANINNLGGCHSVSNFIVVTRTEATDDCVDLNLDIQAVNNLYTQFENASFVFTVTNEGTATATNIEIDASFPDGLVYVGDNASHGFLELAWQTWNIPSLAPGETATLNLTLYALLNGVDIEYFTQVISLDQADKDSTPDSSDGTVTEDDEASTTITPASNGGFGTNEGNLDLELSISTQSTTYDIYEVVRYRIEVTNNGSETATGVVVSAGLPDGMVFTNATVNNGEYSLFFEEWTIDFVGAGTTATLDLDLFTLVSGVDITNFVQIMAVNEQDPDSTPGNSNGQVNEDDEASVTLTFADGLNNATQNRSIEAKMMNIEQAYPNPSVDFIMLPINSEIDLQTNVNVIDVTGRVVSTQTMKIFKGYNRFNIDTAELSDGVYFISLDGLDIKDSNRRFVKISN